MTILPSATAPKLKLVLSGSFCQFLDWCAENGLHPKNHRAKYVSKPEDLRGYEPNAVELVKYGTCYKRDGLTEEVAVFESLSACTL